MNVKRPRLLDINDRKNKTCYKCGCDKSVKYEYRGVYLCSCCAIEFMGEK